MAYTEAHRILLTYVRGLKTVSSDQLTSAFTTLCSRMDLPTDDISASLNTFISEINIKLQSYNFRISTVRDQTTESLLYVFVNTKFDEFIQGCTNYTPPELDCIKQLIDNIIDSHDFEYSLPYTNTKQNIMATLKTKGSEAEFFIKRVVDDGWLELSSSKVIVSPATLAELQDYMIDRYGVFSMEDSSGKLLECIVCKNLVTIGKKCADPECFISFHSKCYTLYTRTETKCPNRACGGDLDHIIAVGVE